MRFFFNLNLSSAYLLTFALLQSNLYGSKNQEITQNEWVELINLPPKKAKTIWHDKFEGSFSKMNWTWRLGFLNLCFKEKIHSDYTNLTKESPWCEEVLVQGLEDKAFVVRSQSLRVFGKIHFQDKIPDRLLNPVLKSAKVLQEKKIGQKSFMIQNYLYAAKRSNNQSLIQEGKKIVAQNPEYRNYWHNL